MNVIENSALAAVSGGVIGAPAGSPLLSAGQEGSAGDTSCKGDGWYTQFNYRDATCVQYEGFDGSSAIGCTENGTTVSMGSMSYQSNGALQTAACMTDGTTTVCDTTEGQASRDAYDSWR